MKSSESQLDEDFLLREDKEKLQKLSQEKIKHLKIIQEIDEKIIVIQNSTRTTIPQLSPLHNYLRARSRWYYKWHLNPYAKLVHFFVLTLYLISLPLLFINLNRPAKIAQATPTYDFPLLFINLNPPTYDFPRWEWQHPQPTGETLLDLSPVQDSTIVEVFAVGENGTAIRYLNNQWQQTYTGTNKHLNGVFSFDHSHTWAVGEGGTILFWNGISWTTQTSGTTKNLFGVFAINENVVWAVGEKGTILKSENGGQQWSVQQYTGESAITLKIIYGSDENNLWAGGSNCYLYKTTNGGVNWLNYRNQCVAAFGIGVTEITSLYNNGANQVWANYKYSSDGGSSWSNISLPEGSNPNNVTLFRISHQIAWCYDKYREKLYFTDNAEEGIWAEVNKPELPKQIKMISGSSSWLLGRTTSKIFSSSNNGSSWQTGFTERLNGLQYITGRDDVLWAGGGAATNLKGVYILKSIDGGKTWQTVYSLENSYYHTQGIKAQDNQHICAFGIYTEGSGGGFTVCTTNGTSWTLNIYYEQVTALDWYNSQLWIATNHVLDAPGTYEDYAFSEPIHDIDVIDTNHVWVTQGDRIDVYDATTGSITQTFTFDSGYYLKETFFPDKTQPNVVWVAAFTIGGGGRIYKTLNGGQNWSYYDKGNDSSLIFALDDKKLWVTADRGILKTSDGGQTWSDAYTVSSFSCDSLYIQNSDTLWFANQGRLLHYHSPPNATAQKLLLKLPGQSFVEGVGIIGTPTPIKAGADIPVTIYAVDNNNVLDKGNTSWVGFTTTDPNDTNPAPIPLTKGNTCVQNRTDPSQSNCGEGTATFNFHTSGTWTITASDINGVLASGTSSPITVLPGSPRSLYFSQTQNGSAGEYKEYKIGLHDLYNNVTTAESDITISLSSTSSRGYFATSSGGDISKTLNVSIPNGQQTVSFWYLDFNVGTPTLTASASGLQSATYVANITPGPVSPDSEVTLSRDNATVDETVELSVWPKDYSGNLLSNTTVTVISSRGNTDSISNQNTDNPEKFSLSSIRSGEATFRVIVNDIYLATAPTLTWNPGSLAQVALSDYPDSQIAGRALSLVVRLYDRFGNLKTNAQNQISFSSSDPQAELPNPYTFSFADKGKHQFESIVLKTAGKQTLTVSESSSVINAQAQINVLPASPSPLVSYITSDKNFIRPNGSDKATISVFITDDYKNPFANKNVILRSNRQEDKIETIRSVTDEKGEATFTITSTLKGEAILTAKNLSDNFTLTNAYTLRVSEPTLADILQSPTAKKIAQKTAPVATAALALGLLPLLANFIAGIPFAAQYASYTFLWILQGLGIKRKNRAWGVVFDSKTGAPVDLAYVRLYNARTYKLVATQLTDNNGRFGFMVPPDIYTISVTKKGYIFPTNPATNKLLKTVWQHLGELKENWYIGQPLTVRSPESIINISIPLDPAEYKPSLAAQLHTLRKLVMSWLMATLNYFLLPLLCLGFLLSVFSALVTKTHFSFALVTLYLLTLSYYLYRKHNEVTRRGQVIDNKTHKPLEGAAVYVFDKKYNTLKTACLTDKFGKFSLYVPEGDYYLRVDYKGRHCKILSSSTKFYRKLYHNNVLHLNKPEYLNYVILIE